MSNNQVFYPFANQPGQSNQNVFPYDIIINEAYPGIIFDPTEPGGVYSVIREVDGCLWFVNNADYDTNSLQWTQEDPTNPALPAYAFELCANGTYNRYFGAATTVPGTPITWVLVYEIDANGSVISSPPTVTASGDPTQQINVTWNAGNDTQVKARTVNITNTSSSSTSVFDQLTVNGTAKWLVDVNGILQVGEIPFARITDFTPTFNNATFTGTTTFNGPIVSNDGANFTDGITTTTLNATGQIEGQSYAFTGGGFAPDTPTSTSAYFTAVAVGSTVGIPVPACTYFLPGCAILLKGASTAAGGVTCFTGIITAVNASPATALTVQVTSYISGEAGDIVSPDAHITFAATFLAGSSDNSISISNTGTAIVPILNLTETYHFPAFNYASFTSPSVGASVSIQLFNTISFLQGQYAIFVSATAGVQFTGIVTSISEGTNPSTVTMTCIKYLAGSAGTTVGANAGFLTFGSYIPDPIPIGGVIPNISQPTTTQGLAGYTVTLPSLPYAANGASCTFALVADTYAELADGANLSLTGGAGSWANTPAVTQDSETNTYEVCKLYGTASSGTAPSVTLRVTTYGGGQSPAQGVMTVLAIRTA